MLLSWCTLVIDAIWYSISPNESIGSLDFFCSLYPPLAWCIITKSVLWINSDGHTKLATLPYYSKYVPPARMTLGGVGNVHKTVDFNHQAVFFIRKVYVQTDCNRCESVCFEAKQRFSYKDSLPVSGNVRLITFRTKRDLFVQKYALFHQLYIVPVYHTHILWQWSKVYIYLCLARITSLLQIKGAD